ncbi:hypothetical protein BGW80DRAFT_1247905 [Lactifluus volemus]|nr:hypothetical protein BGW80DRAFT_1247905 [Lactifluus volemus]
MTIKLEIHPSSSSLDLLGPPDASDDVPSAFSSGLWSSHSRVRPSSSRQKPPVTSPSDFVPSQENCLEIDRRIEQRRWGGLWRPALLHLARHVRSPHPGLASRERPLRRLQTGVSGTQYNLYATMKYANLNRFAFPQSATSYGPAVYSVRATGQEVRSENQRPPIPEDIISKIEMLASVPECVSVDGERFPFSLSVRTPSLSDDQASKLRVSHLSLHLLQIDQYSSALSEYATRYPIPRQKEQPPHKALRSPHPVAGFYDVGLLGSPFQFTFDDVHSLLPPGFNYIDVPLEKGEHASKCAEGLRQAPWLTVEVNVPYAQTLPKGKDENFEWTGIPHLRTTSQGPLFGVRHSIRVVATFVYDAGDSEPAATSRSPLVSLSTLPPVFVRFFFFLRRPRHYAHDAPYHTPELPPYSQLFYPNGDAKYDDSIPLPLYTASPASSSSTLDDVDEEDGHHHPKPRTTSVAQHTISLYHNYYVLLVFAWSDFGCSATTGLVPQDFRT